MAAAIIAAVIGSGGLASLITLFAGRRKTKAETDGIIVKAATDLVDGLTKRIAVLEAKVESQGIKLADFEDRLASEQRETRRLRRWIDLLIQQIRGLGVEPVPEPTEG